ncbi:MAG: hypothetical protein MZV63_59645 [Marinilabiliales bacterium]|nr:hypothetical protein [Marinilabiliales bacterium]
MTSDGAPFESHIEWSIGIPSILIALTGIAVAWVMYRKETTLPDRLASTFKNSYKWAYNKFYIDEVVSSLSPRR